MTQRDGEPKLRRLSTSRRRERERGKERKRVKERKRGKEREGGRVKAKKDKGRLNMYLKT